MLQKTIILAAALLSYGLSGPVIAAVYKCKSSEGKISFQATPCKNTQESIKNRIGGRNAQNTASTDGVSIYGTWVDIEERDSKMVISSSGSVAFSSPDGPDIVGKLSKTGDNKYHVKAALADFDLSSDLTHNLETGVITLKMGPSVTSRFKKK